MIVRRFVDALLTSVALIFFIPTALVLISWNAIPGDKLYGLKSNLENVTLTILSGTPLVPEISMKYTDRRLHEATVLLDKKGSSIGYDLLVAEAVQTQNYISEKNDTQTAVKFSENIDEYKKQIEVKRTEIIAQQSSSVTNPTPSAILPTIAPTPVAVKLVDTPKQTTSQSTVVVDVPQVVVIQQEDPQEVLQKLDEVVTQLNQIQEQVNENSNRGGNGNNNNGRGNNDNDNNSNNNQGGPSNNDRKDD